MPSRDLELPNEITLPYAKFLGGGEPARIARNIRLELTEHTYLPKAHDPRADWVACVGVPAFRAMRDLHPQGVGHFATIGTGAGMDALAAIEILNPRTVTMTDLHQDVVDAALRNVTGNLAGGHAVTLQGEVGELLQPLARSGRTYDLIYENLPNIPLPEGQELKDGMVSSSFVPTDLETGKVARQYLLELHAKLLSEAKPFLTPQGRVLSSIGARVPLKAILDMAHEAGCRPELLTYTWKTQSEAEEVVRGYADWEAKGKGPFCFYPVDTVREVFARYTPVEAARHAFEIEKALEPYRMTSEQALPIAQKGGKLAHTVAVIASKPE